ncbi:MAG: DNA-binding protein [Acidobacteria bacterium]|nr:MAG: DNA-binding protein [Acidobacteriota bacterium]
MSRCTRRAKKPSCVLCVVPAWCLINLPLGGTNGRLRSIPGLPIRSIRAVACRRARVRSVSAPRDRGVSVPNCRGQGEASRRGAEGARVIYLSPEQIAKQLGVSRAKAYRIARECVHVRIGRLIRVPEPALSRYLSPLTRGPWDESTSGAKAARTTATGRTRKAGTAAGRSEPKTRRSRVPASDNLNWYRPTSQRTRGTR